MSCSVTGCALSVCSVTTRDLWMALLAFRLSVKARRASRAWIAFLTASRFCCGETSVSERVLALRLRVEAAGGDEQGRKLDILREM